MNLWQIKATEEMTAFLQNYLNIEKIDLIGSMTDRSLLDEFSDVDMEIHLNDCASLDIRKLLNAMSEQQFEIFGYEKYYFDDKSVLRVCFENGWRFDLTFLYPKQRECFVEEETQIAKIESTINQFWFISVLVLVKLGRKDNLIAAHLALELCQLIIVLQMHLRDTAKSTDFHKSGENEDVPILHALTQTSEVSSKNIEDEIIEILYHSAEHMETVSAPFARGVKQTDKLREIHNKLFSSENNCRY